MDKSEHELMIIIGKMEEEMDLYKKKVKDYDKKLFQIQKSIFETKMLQEKAIHIMKFNQITNEQSMVEMEQVRMKFLELTTKRTTTITDDKNKEETTDDLLIKIGELTKKKHHLEAELKNRKIVN